MMRVAVVGAGVVGLAVTRALRRRECEVMCLEADRPMAARSVGSSRIFRLAHGDPALVTFARRSASLWSEWDDEYAAMFDLRTPRIVRPGALCVTGQVARHWARAMSLAGVAHQLHDEPSFDRGRGLPGVTDGPLLLDPNARVLDAESAGWYLRGAVGPSLRRERVRRLSPAADRVTVLTTMGRHEVDRIVVAAGQGTHGLAAQAGIDTPSALAHHARFTFRLRDRPDRPLSWLDRTESWRPGFTSYQHLSGDNRWSVGAHFGDEEIPWSAGPDAAIARSRKLVLDYVRDVLHGVGNEVLETVYCTQIPGLRDGIHARRAGPVTAIWGNNLFKHAPAIGEVIADAIVTDTEPVLPPGPPMVDVPPLRD
ncbi:MAG TPA: FAD-dependent oxidoreductase [Actinophytocola sp.]|uniref:FAD-dependent oxidoreductase n=1 Tax=Actinophytocola sp. TaxID=1872138 RepID=UPI002DB7332D|nr:FAD-dependent oxidoreductase [Actinophytocola sp.]HEU5472319.1 FAD-dependent oxidoreductase [Actinophytocola sp.]